MQEPEQSNWVKYLSHLKDKPNIVGAEIGTYRGESAEWMAKNIFTHPSSCYYCIDPFLGDKQKEQLLPETNVELETRQRLSVFPQVRIFVGLSINAFRQFQQIFDFMYIDGSHVGKDVLLDSVIGFELLKVGGVIIWDDYSWDIVPDELDRPKIAIDAFLKIYSRSLRVEFMQWQVIATKISL